MSCTVFYLFSTLSILSPWAKLGTSAHLLIRTQKGRPTAENLVFTVEENRDFIGFSAKRVSMPERDVRASPNCADIYSASVATTGLAAKIGKSEIGCKS